MGKHQDIKNIVAQAIKTGGEKYTKSRKGKLTISVLLGEYNELHQKLYGVPAFSNQKIARPVMKNILEKLGGDTEKTSEIINYWVKGYKTFPFVNVNSYPSPSLQGLIYFLPQVGAAIKNLERKEVVEPVKEIPNQGNLTGYIF